MARTVAAYMDRTAEELDRQAIGMTQALRTINWRGADNDAFRRAWHASALTALRRTTVTLRARGSQLRNEADQQESASAASGHGLDPGDLSLIMRSIGDRSRSPEQVARWWASLSQEQRHALMQKYPDQLARMRGLPATDADLINRSRLGSDIARLRTEVDRLSREPVGPLQTAKLAQLARAQKQLDNAYGVRDALERGTDGVQRLLLIYDSAGRSDDGKAAIAQGNPDTADNVAVIIPGMNNSVADMRGQMSNARDLLNTMNEQGTGSNAVITYVYDTPDGLVEAMRDGHAKAAYQDLRLDVEGFKAAHAQQNDQNNDGRWTLAAHSYGSLLAALALHDGLEVDAVAFLGSPGVGVGHVSDLGLSGDRVFVGRTNDDEIRWVDNHLAPGRAMGNGPEDPGFGATTFDTAGARGHSDYYDAKTSLDNLGRIAVGSYDDVTPDPNLRTGSFIEDAALIGNPLQERYQDAVRDGVVWAGSAVDDVAESAYGVAHRGRRLVEGIGRHLS